LRPKSFETLPEFYQRPDVGVGVDCPLLGITSTRITTSQSQNTVIMNLPSDGDFLNFSLREVEVGAIPWIAFCLRFKMLDPGFICYNNPGKEGLSLSFKRCYKVG
jgi:hypothetical protein